MFHSQPSCCVFRAFCILGYANIWPCLFVRDSAVVSLTGPSGTTFPSHPGLRHFVITVSGDAAE